MINRQGQKAGTQRGNRQRFPYEPRVVGGKLMPAELQAIHRYVVETPVLEAVTEEIRAVWRLSGLNLYRSFHHSLDMIVPQPVALGTPFQYLRWGMPTSGSKAYGSDFDHATHHLVARQAPQSSYS